MPSCRQCSQAFEITADDLAFYEKVSPVFNGKKELIPPPALCSECRSQRRLSFRNERNLYHRKCDLTGRQMISMYAPEKPVKVYDQTAWWGDGWDELSYGREFDFSRSFFEQFRDLFFDVPKINLMNRDHENSEYCNFAIQNKNCYLVFTTGECEDVLYCNRLWQCRTVCDSANLDDCERCYEVIDSSNCYQCSYLQNASQCSDCILGYDIQGCKHCFACFGLKHASYCIGNVQYSKEAYEKEIASLLADLPSARIQFDQHRLSLPRKYINGMNFEQSTGDAMLNCKNVRASYRVKNLEDCAFVSDATNAKDIYDAENEDHSSLVYQACGSETNYHHLFSDICWFNKNLIYCSLCFYSEHCFGCVGLKHRKYCILNKQYTKEEYEVLVPRLIEHMRKTPLRQGYAGQEWGEYFPANISPFSYNETIASDYFPLAEAQATAVGWSWRNPDENKNSYLGPVYVIPQNIQDVSDDITKQILTCDITGRPYKIIPQELKFYREMNIPIPRKCPDQRHKERMALRNPCKLWHRQCAKCQKDIQTTYAPERPEIVYCEECYLKTVY